MERRDFLKTSVLATGAIASSNLFASQKDFKTFTISMNYNADFKSAKEIKLYTPLPLLNNYQKMSNFKLEGNFSSHKIVTIGDSPLLFTEYQNEAIKLKQLTLSFDLQLYPYQEKKDTKISEEFLKQTRYVRTDGKIQEIANLAKNLSQAEKVEFFESYIKNNIPIGQRGFSNKIKTIRDNTNNFVLSGESISANSILVALCRASNIPAREVFGFNIMQNQLISDNKAEIFINKSWKRIDIDHENYDFIALNHLRDTHIGDIYTASMHQTLGSIDGNNLKYYKDFSEKITFQQIA
ncbi:transglutaminase domain-containing protein [Helicobacter anatolicus]|uniref:transglutaminase domain-containing protein n=1 Tax=Helicobacter anatolicus TaxID=2905874 RepID=UPI001E2EB06D|nr:transglutaminase family protein [Helicobacter anatolicus]MCE3038406.1 transglutaminase family protein [Helicobacter anatolicus]